MGHSRYGTRGSLFASDVACVFSFNKTITDSCLAFGCSGGLGFLKVKLDRSSSLLVSSSNMLRAMFLFNLGLTGLDCDSEAGSGVSKELSTLAVVSTTTSLSFFQPTSFCDGEFVVSGVVLVFSALLVSV